MKFVFIDDDPDNAEQWLRWAKIRGHKAEHAESVLEANKIRADFYVFDMSAVGGFMPLDHAYSPICTMVQNHPGAVMAIVSGVSKDDRESVIADVLRETPGAMIVDGGWGRYKDFEQAIGDYLW